MAERTVVGGSVDASAGAVAGSSGAEALFPEVSFRAVSEADYVIGDEIARGGMGRIRRARDVRHDRDVAVKELLAPSARGVRRFVREALVAARLQHPGIVPVYEICRNADGTPLLVMKLVEGRPLARAVEAALGLAGRLALLPHVIAATEALAYAHAHGIVHRDLKPGNVIVGRFGETVVIDWGLAKEIGGHDEPGTDAPADPAGDLTSAGDVLGTPRYMSPEQARGEPLDARSDVYSLGALLHHLLAGASPWAELAADDAVARVRAGERPPMPRGVPADLAAIAHQAMTADPTARYASAAEMAVDLRRFLTGELVRAHSYSRLEHARRFLARHRALVAVAVVAFVAIGVTVGVGVAGVIRERDRADGERDAAERLVELTVSQLRERLEPVGRLDVLSGVGTEVLDYYDRVATDGDPADVLVRRARALEALSLVDRRLGNVAAADRELTRAHELLARASRQR